MHKGFWKNKKVLVTGFEGFLGSNLARVMVSSGAQVFGLDIRVKRKNTLFTPAEYRRIKVIKGSVANYNLLKGIIRKNKINVIFHLAAEAIVGQCYRRPLRAFSTNIKGTWNLLEASRGLKHVQSIVVASSDKAYGSHKKLPYTEDAPLLGGHPYDASKSCADLLAYTYGRTYGLPVAITRCGNIYGPGDFNFSRLVPDAIRCALKNKILFIRSDGKFIRDYVYVEDIVNGYITLAEKLPGSGFFGQAFNFSDERPISVLKLIKMIHGIVGNKSGYKILNQAKYEIPRQYLASGKARKVLRWRPQVGLEDGLRLTISWYKQALANS